MKNFNVSVKNVLKVVKDPVDKVHEMFYVSINDISKIEIKWINITLMHWKTTSATSSFWAEVSNYENAMGENSFHDLAKVFFFICHFYPPFTRKRCIAMCLDGKSTLAWELPFLGHLFST